MVEKRFVNLAVLLRITLLLVGIHSIILGGTIYFFTTPFYQFFFSIDPDNVFFVKQSGIFLFLLGLLYLVPSINLSRYLLIIFLVIFSKIIAVTFLLINAHLTPSVPMIYLAALGDGIMAVILTILVLLWRVSNRRDVQ